MDADPANVHPLVLFAVRRIINPVERAMLLSRLHRFAGSSTLMLLTYTGRKSGQRFTVPVGYRQDGNTLASFTPFAWSKNLHGDADVEVILRGEQRRGTATVVTDPELVAPALATYLEGNSGDARFFKVRLDGTQHPNLDDVAAVAPHTAMITIRLEQ
ncbi:MAG TPA: nitroreductase/quinone reductase family protein [Mycobacterium sp.]|jgi:F420H(2)-dependent quinone reductase|nr:nitroreductase/quinone reductase family protein [Mycobacterium sp.]HUH71069.1 nitroreductase/quinone reductase family protein [Mycobacterium sp.]